MKNDVCIIAILISLGLLSQAYANRGSFKPKPLQSQAYNNSDSLRPTLGSLRPTLGSLRPTLGSLRPTHLQRRQASISIQLQRDTGCKTNSDCDTRLGKCFQGYGNDAMCVCLNGLTNYPSCRSETPNTRYKQCDEDCSRYRGYCSADGQCVCSNGGMWPDTCCMTTCSQGKTCYKGRCECMYGKLPNGRCTRCKVPCGPLGECFESKSNPRCICKYGGSYPNCKDNEPEVVEVDCTKQCGQQSTCRKDSKDRIFCTKCGPGRTLRKNRYCPFLGEWQAWSSCSVTCGSGYRTRKQTCRGRRCIRKSKETEECFEKECSGGWSKWGDWEDCSSTCGTGYQARYRECLSLDGCGSGKAKDLQECHLRTCTVERYGEWEPWSKCNKCGEGTSTRKRICLSDIACNEKLTEQRNCAGCSTWNQWSTCSSTCGPGTKTRFRTCPREDGCSSQRTEESTNCQSTPCPESVGSWTNWSECTQCNAGFQTRTRVCLSAQSVPCNQKLSDSRSCVGQPCTQDCSKSHNSAQISSAETLRWEWKEPENKNNRFRLFCTNGCIRVEEATARCSGTRQNVLQYVTSECGGKASCSFTPRPSDFGIGFCSGFSVSISVKCVAGTAMAMHEQAEQQLPGGDIIYNNVQYRCIKRLADWSWADKECRGIGRNWGLAMPGRETVLERLRLLCGLREIPRPTSTTWWKEPADRGWHHYMYWIGGKRSGNRGRSRFLDRSRIWSWLFYPGEPSEDRNNPQECMQANGLIDNENCNQRRFFVCQMTMRGSDK